MISNHCPKVQMTASHRKVSTVFPAYSVDFPRFNSRRLNETYASKGGDGGGGGGEQHAGSSSLLKNISQLVPESL